MTPLAAVDRVVVTTVVDNYIDSLRRDEKVARRFGHVQARKMPDLRAEHGLGHLVEITRGDETSRIAFDFGFSPDAYTHNARELGIDPASIDALALSHGHQDHFGGLLGWLRAHRRSMKPRLTFYGHADHYHPRWNQRPGGEAVYIGKLDAFDIERWDVAVEEVRQPLVLPQGALLSGEMDATESFEPIPSTLRVERDGQLAQDTFIGEQTLIVNVRGRGLVVVTSCSHRGIVGICRHAGRVAGIDKIHAVIGGFHLSGLDDARITQVVDAFRSFDVDWVVPQHCTGLEAIVAFATRMPAEVVFTSTGSRFAFGD
jgi:7,8-dihydropterin-6-yl-methyl-4-(beta-D-ribofuranosyl)aminobenzene 5'-phosphate synthase